MNEVSCGVFSIFFRPLAKKGLPPETLTAGVDVSLAHLRNRKARVDWGQFVAVMANLRPHFTDDEYRVIGRSYMQAPVLRFASVVARLMFTPMDFYRWINKPRDGIGNQMFTCIVPTHRELSARELEVDLTVTGDHAPCWDFFVISAGNFEEMPRLVGGPRAGVEVAPIANGARYRIIVPQRTPLFSKIKRAVIWPFTARAAARELKEAHETLQERVIELEAARTKLDTQARQLAAANQIAELALGSRTPTEMVAAVRSALAAQAGRSDLRLVVDDLADATPGTDPRPAARRWALTSATLAIGHVEVGADADLAMVESLLPTVALVVQKALDQRALASYQAGLEQRVAERTAELTHARDELTATVTRLEEAKTSREKLFHNISHEIRTPLALVLLLVDGVLTHHRRELTPRALAQLDAITVSTRKLVRLVDELLLLASGEERDLQVKLEPIDLAQVLPGLTEGWVLAAHEADLMLQVVVPTAAPVLADVVALERVLANFLSNAIKFTPAGGQVVLTVTPGPTTTRVTIRDTGIGIDDDLKGRLFGRFEQGAGGRALRAGSGIGLSIARELVRAHGADVTVGPNPDGPGTEFGFGLTTSTAESVRAVTPGRLRPTDYGLASAARPTTTTPPGISQGTLLVAEDDPGLAQAIAELLSEHYAVTTVADGVEALAAAQRTRFDLVVTDIEMPGLDGLELAREIQALPGDTVTPVLIMSARAKLGDRLAGFAAGAVDYLTKPFDPSELRARVRAQLAYRALAEKLFRTEKLAALGSLSSGLAHELRNPANGIVNAIAPLRELLPPEALDPETGVGDLIDVMQQCAEQVAYVSKQLLGFRRSGELELRRAPIVEVIGRALASASAALQPVTVNTRYEFKGDIKCAAPLLAQVMVNLLENGAQAAGPGGWIEVATSARPGAVAIEISDSGPGVPPDLRERVFEPFFTTKPPGQGTGLGLATARDLIVRHGGTLGIKVRNDRSLFVIELPTAVEVPR
ncbi:MAG: ATP-binding protein [Kofleriaceae bacterium]